MANAVDILLVDDRREDRLAIESVLESPGVRLVHAASGDDALRRILERDFAVILVDVMMPGMDGFELATVIKQRERSRYTPIIFLTADGSNIERIYQAYSVGAVDYLTKPLDADVLRAKVAIFAELFRKDRRIRAQAEALRAASQRERERELLTVQAANEQRYRNLAEAIPQVVWTASDNGAINYFNRRWYDYTGQTVEQAREWGWMNAIAPDDAERYTKDWHDGLASHSVFELECRLMRRGGGQGWHLCRAVPELGEGGRVVGWLGTFTDCDNLKRACETAEQAVVAREQFLSIASHELRSPLNALHLRLQGLQDELPSPSVVERKVEACVKASDRLALLVDNLFDLTRISSGHLELQHERFDLADAARDVVDRLSELAARARATLDVMADEPVVGDWDRLRIEQVIENLVTNAIRYAANAPISVIVGRSAGRAALAVVDRGPGIAPARPSTDLQRVRAGDVVARGRARARPVHLTRLHHGARRRDRCLVDPGCGNDVRDRAPACARGSALDPPSRVGTGRTGPRVQSWDPKRRARAREVRAPDWPCRSP